MDKKEDNIVNNIINLLQQDYKGINIAVYSLATLGLAYSIHKVRPVSKFSKASQIPNHFLRNHEPMKGKFAGCQHSPVKVLVDHKAPIYLPLWHSSKPPLPVKLWGVDIVSGNAASWLQCVAKDQQVTLKPIARDEDDLVSTVLLHIPRPMSKNIETFDVGQKLVELGFAKAVVPKKIPRNSIESKLAPALLSAEARAKSFRNGIWSELLPPVPVYVVYWQKGTKLTAELLVITIKKLIYLLAFLSKSALAGMKNLVLRPFKPKQKALEKRPLTAS